MHRFKNEKLSMKDQYRQRNKEQELFNRTKFTATRNRTVNAIKSNCNEVRNRNKSCVAEVKQERVRMREMKKIQEENVRKEKEIAYRRVKEQEMMRKQQRSVFQDGAMEMGRTSYVGRITNRIEGAKSIQNVSKELETKEIALLERLQSTYNAEKAMVERLYKVNAESPYKINSSPYGHRMSFAAAGAAAMNRSMGPFYQPQNLDKFASPEMQASRAQKLGLQQSGSDEQSK